MPTPEQLKECLPKLLEFRKILNLHSILKAQNYFLIQLKVSNVIITFSKTQNGLSTNLETDSFFLTTLTPEIYSLFYKLYGDPEVMKSFHFGKAKEQKEVDERYIAFWKDAQTKLSPFSVFAVFKKNDSPDNQLEFIGNISPDHRGDDPGLGELTYLLFPRYWGKGFGKTITDLVLNYYLPVAILLDCNLDLRGEPFKGIIATARTDNPASIKILSQYMHLVPDSTKEQYGAIRSTYQVSVEELIWSFLQHPIELVYARKISASPLFMSVGTKCTLLRPPHLPVVTHQADGEKEGHAASIGAAAALSTV